MFSIIEDIRDFIRHLIIGFRIFNRRRVNLIAGSAIFGVGWGLAGFCPGAALPALGTGRLEVVIFVASLIAGIISTRLITKGREARHLGGASTNGS